MKLKINLLLTVIIWFLASNKLCAQTIGLSGPTAAVISGSVVVFTVTGEMPNKHVGIVPAFADAINNDLLVSGVTCNLLNTNYYITNNVAGKFGYKLINENTVAKTVKLKFRMVIANYATNGTLTTTVEYLTCDVTINPAPPTGINPAILAKISSMGFATDGIVEYSDYYLVEEDIMLSKAYVNSYVLNDPPPTVSFDNINILIPMSSFSSTEWYNSLMSAALAWNSVPNCNIKLNIILGGGTQSFSRPDRIDITLSSSSAVSNVPVISRFPSNDGKTGNQIIINTNFRYANGNTLPSAGQSAWNVIQAIGHCLGFKHTSGSGSENSIMKRGTASSSWSQFSNTDLEILSAKYPFNSSSQVFPFISGKSPLDNYESASFDVSYSEIGLTYSWRVVGINGTVFDETYGQYRGGRLPEESFATGNYQLQCTMNSLKHGTVVAIKNIIVN